LSRGRHARVLRIVATDVHADLAILKITTRQPLPVLYLGDSNNNRVGDLDSFALPFVMRTLGLSIEEVERQLCKESGLKGLSGVSNDIRDIQTAATTGNAKAQLALDVFVASARHWIGAYFLQLNGADALVFTAGIGENRSELRQAICANLDQLGIVLDQEKNKEARAIEAVISADNSRVKVMVVHTNEELVVARETRRLLEKSQIPNPKSQPQN
jgi:acetate kinase